MEHRSLFTQLIQCQTHIMQFFLSLCDVCLRRGGGKNKKKKLLKVQGVIFCCGIAVETFLYSFTQMFRMFTILLMI